MSLIDLTLTEFIETLGSNSPAPGGGSASAIVASVGASLTIMVCELTLGKKKYSEHEECIQQVKQDMIELRESIQSVID